MRSDTLGPTGETATGASDATCPFDERVARRSNGGRAEDTHDGAAPDLLVELSGTESGVDARFRCRQ
jgi:hypothetical protein